MDIEEIRERVQRIAIIAEHDDEGAHAAEDDLYVDVLRAIAEMDPLNPSGQFAREALKAWAIEFERWCA